MLCRPVSSLLLPVPHRSSGFSRCWFRYVCPCLHGVSASSFYPSPSHIKMGGIFESFHLSFCLSACHPIHVSDCFRTTSAEPVNHFNQTCYGGVSSWGRVSCRKNWFTIFNVKVTVRAYIIVLLHLPVCSTDPAESADVDYNIYTHAFMSCLSHHRSCLCVSQIQRMQQMLMTAYIPMLTCPACLIITLACAPQIQRIQQMLIICLIISCLCPTDPADTADVDYMSHHGSCLCPTDPADVDYMSHHLSCLCPTDPVDAADVDYMSHHGSCLCLTDPADVDYMSHHLSGLCPTDPADVDCMSRYLSCLCPTDPADAADVGQDAGAAGEATTGASQWQGLTSSPSVLSNESSVTSAGLRQSYQQTQQNLLAPWPTFWQGRSAASRNRWTAFSLCLI